MGVFNVALLLCFFSVSYVKCQYGQTCNSINRWPGKCVVLTTQCPRLYNLLLTQGNNPEVKYILRQLHCGFYESQPKVCCPLENFPIKSTQQPREDQPQARDQNDDYVPTLPSAPECGLSNVTMTRIVGGMKAKLGAFPWMALLGYKRGSDTQWKCGGSLITHRHVLTAAHCIFKVGKDLYLVRLGELDVSSKTEGASPIDVHIKDITVHENYDYNTFSNDIAVITLDQDVEFNEFIQPICLPFSDMLRHNDFNKYMPLVAGWGAIQFSGSKASRLQFVQLSVLSNGECQDKYAKTANVIDNRAICAGSQDNKDACTGDSGGPLMLPSRGPNRKHFQYAIGVVSHGIGCGTPGIPGVYSRVTEFLPWISKHTTGKTI